MGGWGGAGTFFARAKSIKAGIIVLRSEYLSSPESTKVCECGKKEKKEKNSTFLPKCVSVEKRKKRKEKLTWGG